MSTALSRTNSSTSEGITPPKSLVSALAIPILTAYIEAHPNLKAIGTQHGNITAVLPKVLEAAGKKPGDIIVGGIDLSVGSNFALGNFTALALLNLAGWPVLAAVPAVIAISSGFGTTFFVGAALNLCALDPDNEIKNLRRKLKAGADFFMTQPIYAAEDGLRLLKTYEERHGKLNRPVIVGVLPLVSARHVSFLHNSLYPEQSLQERVINFNHFLILEGPTLVDHILRSIQPFCKEHIIIA